jgi:hypothetical protein
LRRDAGAVVHVPRQFLPEPGGVGRAEVDLEIGAVKTDPDVVDILSGAVEIIDEERSGDGGHADQVTRIAHPHMAFGVVSGRGGQQAIRPRALGWDRSKS